MKKSFSSLLLAVMLVLTLVGCSPDTKGPEANGKKDSYTFVIVPKAVHAWFDEVNKGAQQQAEKMSEHLGVEIKVDYRAPSTADVAEQNSVLEQAAATNPDGIALDPIDYEGNKAVIEEIEKKGIPVVIFDAPAPENSHLSSVGNDFGEQAVLAAERLVELLDEKGKIAVMQGVPSAPNHNERYESMLEYLKQFPNIEVIEGGISNDSIEEAKTQAASIIAANPDLKGYLMSDAAAPVGIGAAVEEAGKVGEIKVVGLENLIDILNLVDSGIIQASSSTRPHIQGSMTIVMLLQKAMGMEIPKVVDTGIDFIDESNVKEWIEIMK
ncbi:substrate-binding domain-containing protein [Erysipelothrix urinaevulpis]|uniref:substrate-binding domain-containing protein n=1 Tax=Erysipelothrix urinaevulpis TaxID=2683717 RepID=UPI00135CD8F8|nr:substrate-binding domain-containing protein [Erysipelothrix urinaevulpis]